MHRDRRPSQPTAADTAASWGHDGYEEHQRVADVRSSKSTGSQSASPKSDQIPSPKSNTRGSLKGQSVTASESGGGEETNPGPRRRDSRQHEERVGHIAARELTMLHRRHSDQRNQLHVAKTTDVTETSADVPAATATSTSGAAEEVFNLADKKKKRRKSKSTLNKSSSSPDVTAQTGPPPTTVPVSEISSPLVAAAATGSTATEAGQRKSLRNIYTDIQSALEANEDLAPLIQRLRKGIPKSVFNVDTFQVLMEKLRANEPSLSSELFQLFANVHALSGMYGHPGVERRKSLAVAVPATFAPTTDEILTSPRFKEGTATAPGTLSPSARSALSMDETAQVGAGELTAGMLSDVVAQVVAPADNVATDTAADLSQFAVQPVPASAVHVPIVPTVPAVPIVPSATSPNRPAPVQVQQSSAVRRASGPTSPRHHQHDQLRAELSQLHSRITAAGNNVSALRDILPSIRNLGHYIAEHDLEEHKPMSCISFYQLAANTALQADDMAEYYLSLIRLVELLSKQLNNDPSDVQVRSLLVEAVSHTILYNCCYIRNPGEVAFTLKDFPFLVSEPAVRFALQVDLAVSNMPFDFTTVENESHTRPSSPEPDEAQSAAAEAPSVQSDAVAPLPSSAVPARLKRVQLHSSAQPREIKGGILGRGRFHSAAIDLSSKPGIEARSQVGGVNYTQFFRLFKEATSHQKRLMTHAINLVRLESLLRLKGAYNVLSLPDVMKALQVSSLEVVLPLMELVIPDVLENCFIAFNKAQNAAQG